MSYDKTAEELLHCVGGNDNVASNALCMTRLRLGLTDASKVDYESLLHIPGVLGIVSHGESAIEVVFGPSRIQGVFDAFSALTGLENSLAFLKTETAPEPLKVQIMPKAPLKPQDDSEHRSELIGQANGLLSSELDDLTRLLDQRDLSENNLEDPGGALYEVETDDLSALLDDLDTVDEKPLNLLVLNGPNINMLGIREPDLYGKADFAALLELCTQTANEIGFAECHCYQSNHEGDLVDAIQDAYGVYDGIVFNPGAYTHTSIAILDALKSVSIPTIEVHISKVDEREDFRQISYVRLACFETIVGEGIEGYAHAIRDMMDHLREKSAD